MDTEYSLVKVKYTADMPINVHKNKGNKKKDISSNKTLEVSPKNLDIWNVLKYSSNLCLNDFMSNT